MDKSYFGTVDLIVFIGLLVLSLLVGAFYAIKDRQENDKENYYFGKRSMSPIPVGLSISVTFMSAITVIGYPVQSYGYGSIILWYTISGAIPILVACVYYIPLIHRLRLTSIFEYLERRFHKGIRFLESFISLSTVILYLGANIYLPALALNTLTPISLTWTIASTSAVCIIYTTLGGMKAVVWTDTFQTFIMFAGVVSAFVKATVDVGGVKSVIEALERGQRNTLWNFSIDPTLPNTFWTIMVGLAFMWCGAVCINQSINQRYLACKSVKDARIAAVVSYVPTFTFISLSALTGLTMYAYFEGCDPIKAGIVQKADQMIPLLVAKVFRDVPGMSGLFVSAALSGTLSTVSSGINAVGALILEDFILKKWPKTKPSLQITISKLIVATFGLLSMGYAFCIQYIDTTIIQLSFAIFGSLGGPIMAVFTLGVFVPWCNAKGAITGQILGTVFQSWVAVSSLVYGKPPEKYSFLPTSTGMCIDTSPLNSTGTTATQENLLSTETVGATSARTVIQDTLFAVSPLYYSVLSFFVTMFVAMAVSFATGMNKPEKMDPDLFVPILDHPCLPEKVRIFFRFGVPESGNKLTWKEGKLIEENEYRFFASHSDSEMVIRTTVM